MTRKIACILLLILAQPAQSAKLYKWIEPDGSITFSPAPPAKGIAFETIGENTDGMTGLKKQATANSVQRPVQQPNPVAALPAAPRLSAQDLQTPKPTKPVSIVNYAPASNGMKPGITRADAQPPAPAVQLATAVAVPRNTTVISSKKRKQCEDLSKRVISLERRLRLDLSAEDMDNTVIHMARYQASFNQHCIE